VLEAAMLGAADAGETEIPGKEQFAVAARGHAIVDDELADDCVGIGETVGNALADIDVAAAALEALARGGAVG
jgi:hypothetical protein